jgi:murein DD-endopeptidase MepM/ murein hydrolase activator NlpD
MILQLYEIYEKISTAAISWIGKEVLFSTILFVFLFPMSRMLKKRSPSWKLGLWSLILLRLMLPPDFSQPYSGRILVSRIVTEIRKTLFLRQTVHTSFFENNPNSNDEMDSKTDKVHKGPVSPETVLFFLWMTGAGISAGLYIRRRRKYVRFIRNASPVSDSKMDQLIEIWRSRFGIKRSIRVVASDGFLSPFTLGIFRPVIYVPNHLLEDMPRKYLESIIAHEMAHIRRFDELWMLIQNTLQILYFFHPVVWIANSRISFYRECICDHMVLTKHKISAETYGNSLLAILKINLFGSDCLKTVSGLGNQRKQFSSRIQNLKGAITMKKNSRIVFLLAYCFLGIFLLPMAQGRLKTSDSEKATKTDSQCAEKKTEDIQNIQIKLINPVPGSKIAAHFGPLIDPFTHQERFHNAVDLRAVEGTEILAPADGTVLIAESSYEKDQGYGKHILIDHGDGLQTQYAHLSEVLVEKGQSVRQGECIGKIGNTGKSTGPHLHFELLKEDTPLDPEKHIRFDK